MPATRPVVETRELGADDWVGDPDRRRPRLPGRSSRSSCVYLVTNAYDRSDELGFAWDDPAVAVAWPAVRATADGRPIVSARDAREPAAGATSWCACATGDLTPDSTGLHPGILDRRQAEWASEVAGPSRD